jgi:hypothetical protein
MDSNFNSTLSAALQSSYGCPHLFLTAVLIQLYPHFKCILQRWPCSLLTQSKAAGPNLCPSFFLNC